LKRRRCDYER